MPEDGSIASNNGLCAAVPSALAAGPTTFQCSGVVAGRFLTLQVMDWGVLHVCEVQVEYQGKALRSKTLSP